MFGLFLICIRVRCEKGGTAAGFCVYDQLVASLSPNQRPSLLIAREASVAMVPVPTGVFPAAWPNADRADVPDCEAFRVEHHPRRLPNDSPGSA